MGAPAISPYLPPVGTKKGGKGGKELADARVATVPQERGKSARRRGGRERDLRPPKNRYTSSGIFCLALHPNPLVVHGGAAWWWWGSGGVETDRVSDISDS
eukprot:scaffold149389_cov29-Tisochrysis_lutea.AAC.1